MPKQEEGWIQPSSKKPWLWIRCSEQEDLFEKRICFTGLPENDRVDAIESCVTEIIIRHYLALGKVSFTSALKEICFQPEDKPNIVQDFLNKKCPDCKTIRSSFRDLIYQLKKRLLNADDEDLKSITIRMEYGNANVGEEIHTLSKRSSFDDFKVMGMLRNLFSLITDAVSIFLVLGDLKPDNLLRTARDMQSKLILNDFDHSVIVSKSQPMHRLDTPGWLSVKYAAPEQIFQESISYATDVFAGCLIAYELLNGGSLPEGLDNANEKQRLAVFEEIEHGDREIKKPLHGSDKLKKLILQGLSINPEDRPTAQEIKN